MDDVGEKYGHHSLSMELYPKDMALDEAIITLKDKIGEVPLIRLLQPSSREFNIIREIFCIIEGLEVPERMGSL